MSLKNANSGAEMVIVPPNIHLLWFTTVGSPVVLVASDQVQLQNQNCTHTMLNIFIWGSWDNFFCSILSCLEQNGIRLLRLAVMDPNPIWSFF